MSDLISRQVLDLWNRYKPTIAVDAIEYDRELKKLLSTNLASLGTDFISRQQAIDGLRDYLVGKRCPDDGTLTCRLIENEVINKLPPIQPVITHEQAIDYLHSTGWMQEHDRQMMLDGVHRLTAQPTIQPKRGHWIEADVCGNTTSWECSCCHNWTGLPTGWNVKAKLWFCPKCTADMREVNHESN